MEIKIFEFNPVSELTYIVYDDTKECIVIDAGCYFEEEKQAVKQFISSNNLTVKHLINTHLHFDHVFGCNFITREYGVGLEASSEDQFLLDQMPAQMRMFGFPEINDVTHIQKKLKEGDIIKFGHQKFTTIHVPGHSPGSLAYYNAEQKCMFVGDVLFQGSIGRTDLVGGNHEQLISGIKAKLLVLPPETKVYSGHGSPTTIGEEIQSNPYLQ